MTLLKTVLILLAGFIGISLVLAQDSILKKANGKPVKLIVMAGQSNMQGRALKTDLSEDDLNKYSTVPDNIFIWKRNGGWWAPLRLNEKFGPEIELGYALSMAFPNEVFGLVKYAVSATTIREWAQSGALFKRLVSDYEASKNRLDDSLLSAILWHQGEKDARFEENAVQYKADFTAFVDHLRNDLGDSDCLFIFGQVNPGYNPKKNKSFPYKHILREAQASVKLPNVFMITEEDFRKKRTEIVSNDGVHYNAAGQIELGNAFASEYIKRRKR